LLWGISPHPPLALRAPCPLCYMFFCCYCLLFIFFSFFPGWGSFCKGATLIWPRVVCGNTMWCLADLVVCVFPSPLGTAVWWWLRTPPGFSI
jgi:hypothetical protein